MFQITKGDYECEIENKEVTQRSKLQVDTRKWYLSKLAPQRYGDKVAIVAPADRAKAAPIFTLKIDNS